MVIVVFYIILFVYTAYIQDMCLYYIQFICHIIIIDRGTSSKKKVMAAFNVQTGSQLAVV